MRVLGGKNRSLILSVVSFLFVFFILTSSFPSIVTDGNTTDSGVFKINYISGTRANDTVNYTQLCLDYIRTEYDNNNISLLNTDERITEETGVNYTVVTVSWLLEDGGLEYEIVSIEQYNKLLYHIYYIENDCIEYVETDNLKDNIFFSFKINNETGYKLYSEKNMLIGGRYILYIPENDIIE